MKKNCVIYAPVDSYSGYGASARDKVRSIIDNYSDEYNVNIISCPWGSLPLGFIKDHPEKYGDFLDKIIPNTLNYQPDLMIWITVPNEVQRIGKFNVLFTAGIETTIMPGEWIEGINKMDLVIMPSKHSKDVALNTVFKKVDPNTNIEKEIKVETPIEVIFEGFQDDIFRKYKTVNDFKSKDLFDSLNNIKEEFNFLFTGMWIGQEGSVDRKNISELIYTFYQTFYNVKNAPGLILKTSVASSNYSDIERVKSRIEKIKDNVCKTLKYKPNLLPNIYVIHGELSDFEMNELYNHPKIKSMISITRGEGFGRPLLEFSITGKPIIASGWSGHVDFLNTTESILIGGQLVPIHPSAVNNMIIKESMWFQPDLQQVSHALSHVKKNYSKILDLSKKLGYYNKTHFSFSEMKKEIKNVFDKYITLPEMVEITLPDLNFDLPELI